MKRELCFVYSKIFYIFYVECVIASVGFETRGAEIKTRGVFHKDVKCT